MLSEEEAIKALIYDNVNVTESNPLKDLMKIVFQLVVYILITYFSIFCLTGFFIQNLSPKQQQWLENAITNASTVKTVDITDVDKERLTKIKNKILESDSDFPKTSALDIEIINHKEKNALCYPNGNIYITDTLFKHLDSDEMLTFVIAHEMAHYKNRDHLMNLRKSIASNFVILTFIFSCLVFYLGLNLGKESKVFLIESPTSFYVDLNKNFVFDEREPFQLANIHHIKENTDYSSDLIFKNLSKTQRFLLENFAIDYANSLIKNKFVEVIENDVLIDGKSYSKLLLESGYFYENTDESKKEFLKKFEAINPDDYVVLNLKNKKYHKLDCKNGKSARYSKIVHIDKVKNTGISARCCFKNDDYRKNIISSDDIVLEKKENNHRQGKIKIFFIDFNAENLPNNYCLTQACSTLKQEIDNAQSTIDFAIYGFNNQPQIYQALKNAKNRGVKIRFVTNEDKSNDKYYPEIDRLKLLIPDNSSNAVKPNKYSLMHNKFFIFDNKKVFTGSANITSTDLSGFNANYSMLIESENVAKIYLDEFNNMYSGLYSTAKNKLDVNKIFLDDTTALTVLFSPKHSIIDKQIIPLINNAKNYIYIPAFFITHKGMKDALINAYNRGVEVKAISDATNAHSTYTIHKELRKSGIKVKTENYAGKMHMKSIFIDDKISVLGSMNFTSSGNKRNDENVVVVENEEITKYLKSTFEKMWNAIPEKYEAIDPYAESLDSIGSCFDGIDNDFDNKIDSKDEGCFIK